jgi:DNA-binding LacI/PurR family transcriptional regulator
MEVASETTVERAYGSRAGEVEDALLEMATLRGPGIKLPTIQELCDQFDTCRPTLDRALASLEQRGVIRRKRGSGIYVSPGIHQNTIGVVFGGDIFAARFSPYWGLLLQAVREQTGARADLRTQAYMDISQGHDGLGGHGQLVEDLEAKRLDGLLLFIEAPGLLDHLAAYGVPVVAPGVSGSNGCAVYDPSAKLRLFAEALAARKCRRVALMPSIADFRQPLEQALRKAGVADAEVSVPYADLQPTAETPHEEVGHEIMQRILSDGSGRLPDAVVSLEDDTLARGAITALLQAGLKPGRDIQVASQVNKGSPVLKLHAADIIQIEIDPAEIVRIGLATLETRMAGRTPERKPVLLAPVLVGRVLVNGEW